MKVAVLHAAVPQGGSRDELDVLVQAEAVSRCLSDLGHDPVDATFSLDLRKTVEMLERLSPDLVFNLVESVEGQGRLIHMAPALLDSLRLPYTGARTEAMFLTSNKLLAKRVMKASGISTPPWFSPEDLQRGGISLHGPYIIKSVWEHASVGLFDDSVMVLSHSQDLLREMESRRFSLGGDCFAEAYVEGREFNLALLGGAQRVQLLPPSEILFDHYPQGKKRVVCYRAKWEEDSFEYGHTPRSFDFSCEESLLGQLEGIARECWALFDLRGYARVDFRVDERDRPWVLEVNANPCLSPDAGFAAAAAQAGLTMARVVERIVEDASASLGMPRR